MHRRRQCFSLHENVAPDRCLGHSIHFIAHFALFFEITSIILSKNNEIMN